MRQEDAETTAIRSDQLGSIPKKESRRKVLTQVARERRKRKRDGLPSMTEEFADAELNDERLTTRLLSLSEALAAAPAKSLPDILFDDASALQALYRLLNNPRVHLHDMLEPHFGATAQRAKGVGRILVIHDATEVSYPFEEDDQYRAGLGILGNRQGFKLMPALAVAGDGSNTPLGLLAAHVWTEDDDPTPTKKTKKTKRKKPAKKRRKGGWGRITADRWLRSVSESRAHGSEQLRRVHVIDAEGEGYKIFHDIVAQGDDFVIRFRKQRNVALPEQPDDFLNVLDAAKTLEGLFDVEIDLTARASKPGFRERRAPRSARTATVTFAASRVRLKKSWDLEQTDPDLPQTLEVSLVSVIESSPPHGEDPVEWLLATSEPIDTLEDVKRVVATYKTRWLIEEFFKALKTGCSFEDRELKSFGALQRLLGMFLVVSWRMLLIRSTYRTDPTAPASAVLSPAMLWVLSHSRRKSLSPNPTAEEVLWAIAALGGHIKNNGPPGLITLRRGLERLHDRTVALLEILEVFRAAKM